MDDETRAALDLSEEDLLRMLAEGEPARIAKICPTRFALSPVDVASSGLGVHIEAARLAPAPSRLIDVEFRTASMLTVTPAD